MDCEKHIDNLIDIISSIHVNKLTVLTGSNGSGKSLIRKLMWTQVNKELGIEDSKSRVSDCSMERRTDLHEELCGMGVALRDVSWTPTSLNTYDFVKGVFGVNERFIVIDEPEIGMSEESILGLCNYINKKKESVLSNNYGILIITHSKTFVSNVNSDSFINIDNMSKDEWLNRKIIPVDFDELEKSSSNLYSSIQKRLVKK